MAIIEAPCDLTTRVPVLVISYWCTERCLGSQKMEPQQEEAEEIKTLTVCQATGRWIHFCQYKVLLLKQDSFKLKVTKTLLYK